ARAYTPENGLWWNPDWPGIGLQVEMQDNLMSVTVYAYDEDGFPMWYTALGFVDDSASVFEANLDEFSGGTCVGCAFRPNTSLGPAGTMRIVFDEVDPTRAVLTWSLDGGPQRTLPIERFQFYLKRQEDGSAPLHTTKMMGEWSATLDFSQNPNNDTGIPFFGDVLVVDRFEFSASDSLWYFDGCRPETSLDGFCTNAALASNDLAGFYDDSVDPGRHVMVVTDTR